MGTFMATGTEARDTVIVGGGHNGLVCAWYLARAGLKVTVCEARPVVGGAAVTEEFHPGFRNSVASYTVSLLNPQVITDMGLHGHGLRIVERPISNFLPINGTSYLKLGGELERTQVRFGARIDKSGQSSLHLARHMITAWARREGAVVARRS